ncbi:WAT1-related protein [Vigna unguiculata]|uniref:WAT1-related protein n=1 Tax=Vigna unguiculata TaxID=3917 RepID=A0A4D6KU76_VIGUN|nr:WAT1-related protein [Vigna unguiculata]
MTFRVFSEIMALAFFEIILDQCFALLGMKFTSASFLSAVMNSAPSITFVMAVILGMEHMKIKEVACQAKVIGTVVTFGGTLLMALYKGPVLSFMRSSSSHASQTENVSNPTGNHWVIGTVFLLIGCAGHNIEKIPSRDVGGHLGLLCRNTSKLCCCNLGRTPATSCLVTWLGHTTLCPCLRGNSYIQGMVIKSMGPVIVTAFNPLRMIIVTGLACIILSEQLYLGS